MEISQLMSGFDVNFVLLSADLHTLDSTSGKQPGNQNWLSIMNAYVYVKQFNHFTIKWIDICLLQINHWQVIYVHRPYWELDDLL